MTSKRRTTGSGTTGAATAGTAKGGAPGAPGSTAESATAVAGEPVSRVDGARKVAGAAPYPNDVTLSGHDIPASAEVLCVLGAGNRDEAVFANPESFDIYRDDNSVQKAFIASADHYAFGFGRHFCIGSRLAQVEARVSMNLFFDTMADLRFADGFVPEEVGVWGRALPKLELRFRPTGALN